MHDRVLVDATTAVIIGQTSVFLAPLIITSEAGTWGMEYARASDLTSIEMLILAIAGILAARLANPTRWRSFFLSGGGAVCIGYGISFIAPTVPILFAGRFMIAVGGGFAATAGASMLATSEHPARKTNRSFAILNLVFAALLFVLPWLAGLWGQRLFFLGAGACVLALYVWRFRWFAAPSNSNVQHHVPHSAGIRWPVTCFFASVTFLWIIVGAVYAYSSRAGELIGLTEGNVGATLSVANLAGMLALAIAGTVGANWNSGLLLVFSSVVATAAGVASVTTSHAWLFVAGIIIFLAANMLQTSYALVVAARFDTQGRMAAAFLSFIPIPFALGPMFMGHLAESHSATWVGSLISIVGVIALGLLKLPLRRLQRAPAAVNPS